LTNPGKSNTVLQDVRIRINQRRSRANKKAYFDYLEQSLKKYELEGVKINPQIWDAASKVLKENQRLRQRIFRHETLNETLNETPNEMLGKEDELAFEDRMIYNEEAPQQEYSVTNFPGELQTLFNGEPLQQHYNFPTELQTPCGDEALQQYYSINNLTAQLQTLCDEEALPKATATSLFPTTNSEFRNGEGNTISADIQSDDPAFIEKIRKGRDQWMTIVGTKMGRYGDW
jgi:hypothetical protein